MQQDLLTSITSNITNIQLIFQVTFIREYPVKQTLISMKQVFELNSTNADMLYQMIFNNSQQYFETEKILDRIYLLSSAGDLIVPVLVEDDATKKQLVLSLNKTSNGEGFWNFGTSTNKTVTNLWVFTISEKYSSITFNFSILTFYISIVYLAGRLIRLSTNGTGMNVIMTDMKDPEHLITLCSGVYASRMIGDLMKEEVLYYELIDILRSSEITKALTGKSSIRNKVKQE